LHRKLGEVAERDGVSINQWISSAVAEKMSAQLAQEYIAERAKRASRKKFDAILARVRMWSRKSTTAFLTLCGRSGAKGPRQVEVATLSRRSLK